MPRSAGPLLLMATLPPFVYWLWICLTFYDGAPVLPISVATARAMIARVPPPTTLAVVLYSAWWIVQGLFDMPAALFARYLEFFDIERSTPMVTWDQGT